MTTAKNNLTKEEKAKIVVQTPDEFFNQVVALNDKLEVNQVVNQFLELIDLKYEDSTISSILTRYRDKFKGFKHENKNLMETVTIENVGTISQHIAVNLLVLSNEQMKRLAAKRQQKDLKSRGFDESGELREIELPAINVVEIIEQCLNLLHSDKSEDIVIGIAILIGKRSFEICVPSSIKDNELIERDLRVIDKFSIAFKGLAKKRDIDNNYYKLPTLATAQIIYDAYQKLRKFSDVKSLEKSDNRTFTNSALRKRINRRFEQLFGDKLSTIAAYDDNGKLIDKDGTIHKARAFYACTIRAILTAKNVKEGAIFKIIQNCLHHESVNQTIEYLGKYDSHKFINIPTNIDIPTNINKVGVMSELEVNEMLKTTVETVQETIVETKVETVQETKLETKVEENTMIKKQAKIVKIDELINACSGNAQTKIAELTANGMDIKNVLIELLNSACEDKIKRVPVSDTVSKIIECTMIYNRQVKDITEMVYPTYNLISKTGKKLNSKTIAKTTYDDTFNTIESSINDELANKGIPLVDMKNWNNKHHRKDTDDIIDIIISIIHKDNV